MTLRRSSYARNEDTDEIGGEAEYFSRGKVQDDRYWKELGALADYLMRVTKRRERKELKFNEPARQATGRTIYLPPRTYAQGTVVSLGNSLAGVIPSSLIQRKISRLTKSTFSHQKVRYYDPCKIAHPSELICLQQAF